MTGPNEDAGAALALWDALKPKLRQMIREETRSAVRKKKMEILSINPSAQTVTVYEAANPGVTITIPYRKESGIGGMTAGQSVMVEWTYDDLSTAVAATPGQGWSGAAVEGYDSGYQNAVYETGFQDYGDTNLLRYRRTGNTVEIIGACTPTAEIEAGAAAQTIFTLPAGYRPTQYVYAVCQGSGQNRWLCSISPAGTVAASRYGTTASIAIPTGAWLTMTVTFTTMNAVPT